MGVFDRAAVTDVDVPLEPGDLVLLFTDGVTEARGGDSWFGEDRLREAVSRHRATAATLTAGVLDEVLSFQSGFGRDDVVLLALCVPPAPGDPDPPRSVP
jgi:serine phosphatase RsbU (regulator of sigma subunit)